MSPGALQPSPSRPVATPRAVPFRFDVTSLRLWLRVPVFSLAAMAGLWVLWAWFALGADFTPLACGAMAVFGLGGLLGRCLGLRSALRLFAGLLAATVAAVYLLRVKDDALLGVILLAIACLPTLCFGALVGHLARPEPERWR